MNRLSNRRSTIITSFLLILFLWCLPGCETKISYPRTDIKIVTDTLHGVAIEDPYRWLEDQQAPETRAWIEQQNNFLEDYKKKFPDLDKIRNRMLELTKVSVVHLPWEAGGKYFYEMRMKDEELFSIYVRDGLDGQERKLVDPGQLNKEFTQSISIAAISKNGDLLAYNIREGGQDEVVIKLLDVNTGQYLEDVFLKANYSSFEISGDNQGCFYTRMEEQGSRVYYHQLGTPFSQDNLIFGEGYGADKYISASLSEDKKYLLIVIYYGAGGTKSEIFLKDVINNGPVKPLVTGIDAQFYPSLVNEQIYLLTNWEAPNRRVMVMDLSQSAQENWRQVIPESEFTIESFGSVGGKLFVNYLENVTGRIKIFTPDGQPSGEIALPTLGSVSGIYGRWESNHVFYQFSSYTYPDVIYSYNIAENKSTVWSKKEVPINTDDFEVKQVWFSSKDSTWVPMFVVHRKDIKLDGNNPTMLYGYGGFTVNVTPEFVSSFAQWVEMGGVLVEVNLRGGAEFGENWHRNGMLEKKQNTFDDFIAAAQWLIDNKYTNPTKLAAMGGSNGGLLVGAALTQRPDLFKAIVCTYPLLDMLRYHNKMLGPLWISEYGSADSVEQFKYIYKYSPYQNVKAGIKYPAVLFITGDGDTRVDPMHARKMTALLQARTGSDNPILLHYETAIGHSGEEAISKGIEQRVDWLGFLCWQLGLKP